VLVGWSVGRWSSVDGRSVGHWSLVVAWSLVVGRWSVGRSLVVGRTPSDAGGFDDFVLEEGG
jgi:hypothetical protein